MSREQEALPYWLVNVPANQRPTECPGFLADANEKDKQILATPDSDYCRLSWPEVQDLIRKNRIDLFQRVPSDLRRYKGYTAKLKKEHGSVVSFVLSERLRWQDLVPRGEPFSNPDDIKILFNDWPYGIDTRIVHLVVWVKFPFEEDPVTGDLTDSARKQVDSYVEKTFRARVGSENCIWFKNWASLKSIHAVEHFHVMLFDPDIDFVEHVTNNDVPLVDKIGINDF
ncbi:hypothetical protein D6D19_07078 [Aureobasidium pullulans]|uniref:Uncharacterized protein n=1 Tax=Aureobasidium pullulans TaxID=5580 RepID=A0A4S8SFX7_AURPU|nr:hypothetical protein D6D28_05851 [Aureobasidium pullulans]THW71782.1 hypothetical protein D6D19_07078 [Aureobasidium pullulans]